jgi:hypothetical protein
MPRLNYKKHSVSRLNDQVQMTQQRVARVAFVSLELNERRSKVIYHIGEAHPCDRANPWRFSGSKFRCAHARKISSPRLIVAKLKNDATYARSLNLCAARMNFFETTDVGFDTVFVSRSRNTTVIMPGMSARHISTTYLQSHLFGLCRAASSLSVTDTFSS